MKDRFVLVGIVLDLLAGLVAAGLYALFSLYSFNWRGMGTLFGAVGVLFLCAGFVRGTPIPAWSPLKALLVVAPFGIALKFLVFVRFELIIQAAIALSSVMIGIYARRRWKSGDWMQSLFILGAALGVLDLIGLIVAPILAQKMTTRVVDVPVRQITARRLGGERISPSELNGTVTVLYFWATWCPPCWQEFPKVEKLYERYESNPSVVFLAINAGEKGDTPEIAKAFIKQGAYGIPAAFDARQGNTRFPLPMIPCLLIIDSGWHVRLLHTGYDGSEHFVTNISKVIDALLEEARQQRPDDRVAPHSAAG